ncbi:MAG: flavin reductase [Treponema sp.]|jgi:flavin reductase (DIM6/NTAB) family NADH-FMN oxidoreductase RutF/rubredoxin|nr:flavin reductase [Treponema sp.]
MDNKALYNLSYGVFVLGSCSGEKINACITNTCMQVASNPTRIAISVLNQNLTCDMIKSSGIFSLSVLDNSCKFDLIKHFGMQSGKNTDKFADFSHELDSNGCPYIKQSVCSVLKCKVLSSTNLESHTLFIAEVQNAFIVSKNPPLTYADYQNKIKPKPAVNNEKKIIGWRCKICGYEYMNPELPADFECPLCGHPAEDFEPIYAE